MNIKKMTKNKKRILRNQERYKNLREKARMELIVLEEYFGKGKLDDLTIYSEIKRHLEANQKEISYFGLRGIVIGLITTIFVYLFNNQITSIIGQIDLGNWLLSFIFNLVSAIILSFIFFSLFFISTGDFFISDWRRRNQIYINEYVIKLVEEKISAIGAKQK